MMRELFDTLIEASSYHCTEDKHTKITLTCGSKCGQCHMKKTEHETMFSLGYINKIHTWMWKLSRTPSPNYASSRVFQPSESTSNPEAIPHWLLISPCASPTCKYQPTDKKELVRAKERKLSSRPQASASLLPPTFYFSLVSTTIPGLWGFLLSLQSLPRGMISLGTKSDTI